MRRTGSTAGPVVPQECCSSHPASALAAARKERDGSYRPRKTAAAPCGADGGRRVALRSAASGYPRDGDHVASGRRHAPRFALTSAFDAGHHEPHLAGCTGEPATAARALSLTTCQPRYRLEADAIAAGRTRRLLLVAQCDSERTSGDDPCISSLASVSCASAAAPAHRAKREPQFPACQTTRATDRGDSSSSPVGESVGDPPEC